MSLVSATDKRHVGRMRIIERPGGSLIFLTYVISSSFSLQFDLKPFPFDSQKIRLTAVFWHSPYDAVTSPDNQGRVRAEIAPVLAVALLLCAVPVPVGPPEESQKLSQRRIRARESLRLHPQRSARAARRRPLPQTPVCAARHQQALPRPAAVPRGGFVYALHGALSLSPPHNCSVSHRLRPPLRCLKRWSSSPQEGFIDRDAWRVSRDVHMWAGVTDEKRRAKQDGVRFSKLYIGLTLKRRHEYYVLNAILPNFLFVTFSFLSFGPTDGDQSEGGAGLTDKTQITLAMARWRAGHWRNTRLRALPSLSPFLRCMAGR